ncbi:ABC transporter ATP-binding protein [Streptosporangium sp. NPDC002607]
MNRSTEREKSDTLPNTGDREALALDRVTVSFTVGGDRIVALDDVSFEVEHGGFLSVLGPSGCGKSTTLRLIADLLHPGEGELNVLGDSPGTARAHRRVGFVFQDATLLPWRRVIDNVLLPTQVGPSRVRGKLGMSPDEALAVVGLTSFSQAYPSQLSGGMRQRVAIARALVTKPDILLMDEPFGALDELTRDRLNVQLLDIWQASKTTIVFVTHSIPEAVFLGQRVILMSSRPGRVRATVEVPLPYPRELSLRDSPQFTGIVAQLRRLLTEEEL